MSSTRFGRGLTTEGAVQVVILSCTSPMAEQQDENGALEVLNPRSPNVRGVQALRTKRTLADEH